MPSRAFLSEEAQEEEREGRDRLHEIDRKIDLARSRRLALVGQVRALSAEQKKLFDARQEPQQNAERLHVEHVELGRRLSQLRSGRETARNRLVELTARAREVRAEIPPSERVRPERVRKEIADLEVRQQTHALSLAEENALIGRLREQTRLLHELEAHEASRHEHERRCKEADAAVREGRDEVDRVNHELIETRAARERKMEEIRSELVRAGTIVAQIREKALARRELMAKLDAAGAELDRLDHDARQILAASRSRRQEAHAAIRTYAPRRSESAPGERAEARANARLEELLKRGKVSL